MGARKGIADGKDIGGSGLLQSMYGLAPPVQSERESSEEQAARNFYGEPAPGEPERGSLHETAQQLLLERVKRVMSDARFVRAAKALSEFQRERLPNEAFSLLAAMLACLAVAKPKGSYRKAWEPIWASGTGKTWKALTEFPDRLDRVAEEVERLNGSIFFPPGQFIRAETAQAKIVRRRFEILPGMLRFYAEGLRRHIPRIPALTARLVPPPARGHGDALPRLSMDVTRLTGKPRDKQVAELLNAAAIALGEEDEFDALSIAQARSRRRKGRKT